MTIREQLRGLSADERARLKAQVFAQIPTKTFTRGAYTFTLSNPSYQDKVFSVHVVVEKGGVEVLRDEFRFVNPPIMVPDGTFSEKDVTVAGETQKMLVHNYREDPVEALKQALIETVKQVLR